MSFSPLSKLGIIQNLNYITNSDFNNFPFASNATLGWSLKNGGTPDATTKLPTSAPSAAAAGTLTLTAVTGGSQISGTVSASLSSTAATTAGDMMITDALTLDLKAQSTIQTFSFSYKVSANGTGTPNFSGTSSNAIGVAIYDVTNSAWIQPAGVFNLVQSSGVGRSTGTFQVPSNCTSVRLAVYFPNSTAASAGSPFTVIFDDFVLGPQTSPTGAAVSDWVSYTPTLEGTTSNPTVDSASGKYRRVGDSVEIQARVTITTPGSGSYILSIPSGISIDYSKMTIGAGGNTDAGIGSGNGYVSINSGGTRLSVVPYARNSAGLQNKILCLKYNSVVLSSADFVSNLEVWVVAKIPVTGLSSNTVLSQDTDTRVVAFYTQPDVATGTLNTSSNIAKIPFTGISTDSHGAYSASTGYYTIPVSGYYQIKGGLNISVSTPTTSDGKYFFSILRTGTGTLLGTGAYRFNTTASNSYTDYVIPVSADCVYLNAGTQVGIFSQTNATCTYSASWGGSWLSVNRLSGPATIAASETVACRYKDSSGANIPGSAGVFKYTTKDYDTHGFYSTSTGLATIPVSGKYSVTASIHSSVQVLGVQQGLLLYIYKNGSAHSTLAVTIGNGNSNLYFTTGSDSVQCVAGDTLAVYALWGAAVNVASNPDALYNHIEIKRVGN